MPSYPVDQRRPTWLFLRIHVRIHAFEDNSQMDTIYTDFAKAFEKVCHSALRGKISEKMEKIYYHYDTEARKRPHNSVILKTN